MSNQISSLPMAGAQAEAAARPAVNWRQVGLFLALAFGALVVLLLLRDPVWREAE